MVSVENGDYRDDEREEGYNAGGLRRMKAMVGVVKLQ